MGARRRRCIRLPRRFAGIVAQPAAIAALSIVLAAGACSSSPGSPGAAGSAPARSGSPAGAPASASAPATSGPTSPSGAHPRPATLVAVTTAGAVEVLDPTSGKLIRTLASGATGDAIALTPDGRTVYYQAMSGCFGQVMRVPVSGGTPSPVVAGSLPAISPDGRLLAYAVEPVIAADNAPPACPHPSNIATEFSVEVRRLATGAHSSYPLPPAVVAGGLPEFIDHLSWAPDNRRLVVGIGGGQDNEQWNQFILDTTVDRFYTGSSANGVALGGIPVSGARGTYYREAAFLPDGSLFVNAVCCAGYPANVVTSTLAGVDPSTGASTAKVAIGFTNVDHTSLGSDASGYWLLYLAGNDLEVSAGGARPSILTAGLVAAAW